jgi:hypothetical protein
MEVVARREWSSDNKGGDLVLWTRRRRYRLAAYWGTPPGSHIGFWRTRAGGLRGINLRIGRRYVGPFLTILAHTRRRHDWEA